ncbi:alpha/beta fold hydrolase [Dietzia sp.]|uniref:alpha/beta fold hydrolase n=1 Tax=Dietzia sp. TaxID=1871616 RepID=UPI002FD933F4
MAHAGNSAQAEEFEIRGRVGTLVGDRWTPVGVEASAAAHPPVLMLHGGAQTRHSWDRAARALAESGIEVLTLDARGHGDSDWAPDGDYDIFALADDLAGAAAQLFPSGRLPVLVGASLGGITGLIALGRGDAVACALVLVDVAPKLEVEGVQRVGDFMRSGIEGFDSLEQVAELVSAYQPHRKKPQSVEGLKKNLRQRDDGRWYWHWDPRFADTANGENAAIGEEVLSGYARRVEVPTMLLRGQNSDVIAADAGDALRKQIPHVYTHEVERAGHMIVGDDNAVFLGNLRWFLDEISPGPDAAEE